MRERSFGFILAIPDPGYLTHIDVVSIHVLIIKYKTENGWRVLCAPLPPAASIEILAPAASMEIDMVESLVLVMPTGEYWPLPGADPAPPVGLI